MGRLILFGSIAIPVLLAACAGGGTPATSPQGGAPSLIAHVPSVVDPLGRLDTYIRPRRQMASYYACPSTGTTEYVSDALSSVIYIYSGKFVGQSPCGQIASTSHAKTEPPASSSPKLNPRTGCSSENSCSPALLQWTAQSKRSAKRPESR